MYVLMVVQVQDHASAQTERRNKYIKECIYSHSLAVEASHPSVQQRKTRHVSGEQFCFFCGANLKEREWRIEG